MTYPPAKTLDKPLIFKGLVIFDTMTRQLAAAWYQAGAMMYAK
jgi:hypothetical protein